jgi:hypothetical protein
MQYAMRVSAVEFAAEATGFDHFSAVVAMWVTVGGVFPWVVVPAFFALHWTTVLVATVVAALAALLLVLLLRYRIRVLPGEVIIERYWVGIRYKRVAVPNGDRLEFIVMGTGDWGDDGPWPGRHYCEIASPGTSDLFVGTPGKAEELALWLSFQARRLLHGDA